MKKDIADYIPREPAIVAVSGHTARAWIGDMEARVGRSMWVADQRGRVERLVADHEVEARFFAPTEITAGDPVRIDEARAHWPTPRAGRHRLDELTFEEHPDPAIPDRDAADEAISTGIDVIDRYAPLVRGGVNVILDASSGPTSFGALLAATEATTDAVGAVRAGLGLKLWAEITLEDPTNSSLAHELAIEWGRELGAAVVLEVELGTDLDTLTHRAVSTVFVRIPVDADLEPVAETLSIGTTDSQLFLRPDGRIDFTRSFSRLADGDTSRFARAAELRERMGLFGRDELAPAEIELLDAVDEAELALVRRAQSRMNDERTS